MHSLKSLLYCTSLYTVKQEVVNMFLHISFIICLGTQNNYLIETRLIETIGAGEFVINTHGLFCWYPTLAY